MSQKRHIMHGRDHCPGGADPIPCLGSSAGAGGSFVEYMLDLGDLRGWWRLGEPSGNFLDSAVDVPGGPFPMTPGGTPTRDVAGAILEDDGAAEFGTGDYAQSGTGVVSTYETSETIVAWVNPEASASAFRGFVFAEIGFPGGVATGQTLEVQWPGGTSPLVARFTRQALGSLEVTSASGLDPGSWYHLAATFDGTTRKLYVNGTLVDADTDTISVSGPPWGSPQIGGGISGDYQGVIDEVAFFGRVLTAAEIANLYTYGTEPANQPEGYVQVADGEGGLVWAPMTSVAADGEPALTGPVTLSDGAGITLTQTDQNIEIAASPASDTHAWMPLTTVSAGVPELVWDGDDQLIPTLTNL